MTAQEHANAIWRAEPSPEALAGAISAYTDELRGELHRVTVENAALREEVEELRALVSSLQDTLAGKMRKIQSLASERDTASARIAAERDALQAVLNELNVAGGVTLIAKERLRQISEEGWTPEHDSTHDMGELADAATCYITGDYRAWPWGNVMKPAERVRDLTKAGALIAAEIDRLQRKAIKALSTK